MPLSFLTKQAHRRRQFFSAYGWIAPALGLALLLLFATWVPTTPVALDPVYGKLCKPLTLAPGQQATLLFGAYQGTGAASESLTPADAQITDDDTIIDRPYTPADDEVITEEEGLPHIFLPQVIR